MGTLGTVGIVGITGNPKDNWDKRGWIWDRSGAGTPSRVSRDCRESPKNFRGSGGNPTYPRGLGGLRDPRGSQINFWGGPRIPTYPSGGRVPSSEGGGGDAQLKK